MVLIVETVPQGAWLLQDCKLQSSCSHNSLHIHTVKTALDFLSAEMDNSGYWVYFVALVVRKIFLKQFPLDPCRMVCV